MKISIVLIVFTLIFAIGLTGCSTVKDYVYQNKDLIILIIKTLVEQLTQPISSPTAMQKGVAPNPEQLKLDNIISKVESDAFWCELSPKLDDLIKNYKAPIHEPR